MFYVYLQFFLVIRVLTDFAGKTRRSLPLGIHIDIEIFAAWICHLQVSEQENRMGVATNTKERFVSEKGTYY